MSKAVDEYILKEKILAVIAILQDEGISAEDIIEKVIEKYHVTEEYVSKLIVEESKDCI